MLATRVYRTSSGGKDTVFFSRGKDGDPPVVDVVDARSGGHLLGPYPGQSYIPREVSCPLEILYFVYS